MAQEGDEVFYIDPYGAIDSVPLIKHRPLDPNESLNKHTLGKVLKYIQLQNFADEVNEETDAVEDVFCIYYDDYDDSIKIGSFSIGNKDGNVRFSSLEAAQKAIDYFGRGWLLDYLR